MDGKQKHEGEEGSSKEVDLNQPTYEYGGLAIYGMAAAAVQRRIERESETLAAETNE